MLRSAKLAPVFPYDDLVAFWRDADELGFHAIWDYDHFYGLGGNLSEMRQPTFEGWTILAAMATIVKRARIGCMVTGVTYRKPALLANMAVTVDHISGGRLEFGIGAAWHEPEHRALGFDYPRPSVRFEMLDETIEICRRLWTEDLVTFEGKHHRVTEALCEPKPVQKPHPPIVVGASGKVKGLRVVAKHATEWNSPVFSVEQWSELSGILDDHCAAIGRDPTEIRRSAQIFIHPQQEGQADQMLESLKAYEDAGCEHIVLSFYQPPGRALLEKFAP